MKYNFPPTPIPDDFKTRSMDREGQVSWLTEALKGSIGYVSEVSSRMRRLSLATRLSVLVLSGLVTIALGVRWEPYSDLLRNVAFVFGAVATIVGAIDSFLNYRELWIEHEEAEWRFHRLEDRLAFLVAGANSHTDISEDDLNRIHDAYQWIWDNLSKNWLNRRIASTTTSD